MKDELVMLVNQECEDMHGDWEKNMPDSLSKKVTMLVDNHPYEVEQLLKEYVDYMDYTGLTETDIHDAAAKYRQQWQDMAYHVLGQYYLKRNG